MKTVTNAALVRRRARLGTLLSLSGLGVLLFGLYLNFQEQFVPAYGALVVGALLSWSGVALADKWVRPPRADVALGSVLEGLSRGHVLYSWVLPVEHVLLTPWGLVALNVNKHDGQVEIEGDDWHDRRPLWRRLFSFGRRPVRNPSRLLQLELDGLANKLEEAGQPEVLDAVPIELAAVFAAQEVELSVEDPDLAVVELDGLRRWLKRQAKEHAGLKPAERREVEQALDALAAERLEVGPAELGGDEA